MNRILLAVPLAYVLCGPALAAYQDEVLADNPVAYYRFEETSGTTAFDTANSNDGSYVNGVLLNQPGAPALADGRPPSSWRAGSSPAPREAPSTQETLRSALPA